MDWWNVVVNVVAVIVAVAAARYAFVANARAADANLFAKDANQIAREANRRTEESNRIAQEALDHTTRYSQTWSVVREGRTMFRLINTGEFPAYDVVLTARTTPTDDEEEKWSVIHPSEDRELRLMLASGGERAVHVRWAREPGGPLEGPLTYGITPWR